MLSSAETHGAGVQTGHPCLDEIRDDGPERGDETPVCGGLSDWDGFDFNPADFASERHENSASPPEMESRAGGDDSSIPDPSLNEQPTTPAESIYHEALGHILSGVSDLSRYDFKEVDGTRLVKYRGVRAQWDYDDAAGAFKAPQLFLSFSNHLGSTSAVIDYADGALVEWKTHYAYGADESGWKNADEKYDNADEPYGFTGKEEDTAVGLHYFNLRMDVPFVITVLCPARWTRTVKIGARYYSSYIGRWLGPDPPVVHGGGFTNHFNYGGNSPYIYVDPDGNWVEAVIAAVVGGIIGHIQEGIRHDGDPLWILWGGVKGAGTALVGVYCGPWAAAGASVGTQQLEMAATQGVGSVKTSQFHLQSAITMGTSLASSYASVGISAGTSSPIGRALANYGVSLASAYQTAAVTGSLSSDNWDDILLSTSASYWGSYGLNAIGTEVAYIGAQRQAGANGNLNEQPAPPEPVAPGGTGGGQPATSNAEANGGGGDFIKSLPGVSDAQLDAFVDNQSVMKMPTKNIKADPRGVVTPGTPEIVSQPPSAQEQNPSVSTHRVPAIVKTTTREIFNQGLGMGRTTSSSRIHHEVLDWGDALEGHIPIEQNIKTLSIETTRDLNMVTTTEIREIPYGPPSANIPSTSRRINDIMNTIQHISPFVNSPLKIETGTKENTVW